MNPFELKPEKIECSIMNWEKMYPKPYNKYEVSPYTKTRIILMNGTEFEANWFSHQFSRHCNNNDIRRELAMTRRIEKMQQMKLQCLKPINENQLETTISYEQLAVDLTACMAQKECDVNVKNALDFALLEDFDHLYRYSNLLEMEYSILPEKLVGRYTEIMPARPTMSHHRHPCDTIFYPINPATNLLTKLHVNIITAAEQQTMNFYMNIAGFYTSDLGRKLYQEIGMVEEIHVSQYESLKDPNETWIERLLMHEYTECYLYYSCFESETDPYIKRLWEMFFRDEVIHLHKACELLEKYEHKSWQEVIPNGTFPELLILGPNVEYVRDVLKNTVNITTVCEDYIQNYDLPLDSNFFNYQREVNCNVCEVPSHLVIDKYICKNGIDYRFEVAPNPICQLQNRRCDNVCVGRQPMCEN